MEQIVKIRIGTVWKPTKPKKSNSQLEWQMYLILVEGGVIKILSMLYLLPKAKQTVNILKKMYPKLNNPKNNSNSSHFIPIKMCT